MFVCGYATLARTRTQGRWKTQTLEYQRLISPNNSQLLRHFNESRPNVWVSRRIPTWYEREIASPIKETLAPYHPIPNTGISRPIDTPVPPHHRLAEAWVGCWEWADVKFLSADAPSLNSYAVSSRKTSTKGHISKPWFRNGRFLIGLKLSPLPQESFWGDLSVPAFAHPTKVL